MTSFRSNLNSVSNTYESLTAIKNRITTCLKHWRRKSKETKEKIFCEANFNYKAQQKRGVLSLKCCQQNCKEHYILQKTNENLRNFNSKLKKLFSPKLYFPQNIDKKNLQRQKVEFVAKLLSSTLISTQSTINSFGNTSSIGAPKTAVVEDPSKMTITEDTFQLLRQEYPDLDAEVRGILMARAQTGATIGEIREDYRKNTGVPFPVYENVTDFLLCIPGVTAFCSERGTRIFNVKPTEKTKHLHNLVLNQKAPSERSTATTTYSNNRYKTRRDSGTNAYRSEVVPLSWRANYNHCYQPAEYGINSANAMSRDFQRNQQQLPPNQYHLNIQTLQQPALRIVEERTSRSGLGGFTDNRNGSYQDNCQYLFNRIYKNCETNKSSSSNIHENFDNRSETNSQLNIPTLPYQSISNSNSTSHNNRDSNLFKPPIEQGVHAAAIHSSSPSGTKTTSDSMSIFSSEYNYNAHLLDFPLLGDDFFLYLARMELKCKFKQNEKVLQSGLCISGQTIKAATKRVSRLSFNATANRRIILNIGSVDIMQGKTLVQIEHDFRNLINIISRRGMLPILTTLAPLANYAHDATVKTKLDRFNEFIKREGQYLLVIDIWSLFVNERRQTLFDCYQNEPRQVTGANESYVFWNKIGRQRVLQLVESELEY